MIELIKYRAGCSSAPTGPIVMKRLSFLVSSVLFAGDECPCIFVCVPGAENKHEIRTAGLSHAIIGDWLLKQLLKTVRAGQNNQGAKSGFWANFAFFFVTQRVCQGRAELTSPDRWRTGGGPTRASVG